MLTFLIWPFYNSKVSSGFRIKRSIKCKQVTDEHTDGHQTNCNQNSLSEVKIQVMKVAQFVKTRSCTKGSSNIQAEEMMDML